MLRHGWVRFCHRSGRDRHVDVLLANAGRGLGKGYLDQDFDDILHVVNTNITGTINLIHRIGQRMRIRGEGRILIVGSIAGFTPGTYQAVYNASKAFLDLFLCASGRDRRPRRDRDVPDASSDRDRFLRTR